MESKLAATIRGRRLDSTHEIKNTEGIRLVNEPAAE
jgi:hypothetical protein